MKTLFKPLRISRTIGFLCIAIIVGFLIQQTGDRFFGLGLRTVLGLVPTLCVHSGAIWQFLTYGFLHSDVVHLFLNLLLLVFIGTDLEQVQGSKRFLSLYFFSQVLGALVYVIVQGFFFPEVGGVPMVGASGAIYGLLYAYGRLFAERELLFMMVFPLKAKHFTWLLIALEFMTTLFSTASSALSSLAHLGGLAGGALFLWLDSHWRARSFIKRTMSKARSKSNLRLVVDNDRSKPQKPSSPSDKPKTWH